MEGPRSYPSALRRPYIWSRAYSDDQVQKIYDVERMRRSLSEQIFGVSKFARSQLRDPKGWYNVGHSFDGLWQGESVVFDPVIRPLYLEYGTRLYELAAQEALERFPRMAEHVVVDGPDLGERRLHFTTGQHDLALPYMANCFWSLDEKKAVAVAESIRVELDDSVLIGGRRQIKLFISLDRPSTDESTWDEVRSFFAEGKLFPIDETPRQCDVKLAANMRTTMSIPDLVLLNWKEVRKPLTSADDALFKAIETFNPDAIASALADGADPNAIDTMDDTPLVNLISSDRWEYVKPERGESWEALQARIPSVTLGERKACVQVLLDAGAHIDVCGAEGTTAVTAAVLRKEHELLDWLLSLGGDDTIHHEDSRYGDWPAAWDYAATDLDLAAPDEREAAELTWRALRRHRQAPNGTLPGERPEW